nr:hypothetical protein [Tanacetum cinerariifolium]
ARIMFRGTAKHHETETPLVDPDENQIDAVNKVQSSVHYPTFDPDILWDKMEPTVGMRYETPHQLKLALVKKGNKDRVMKNKVRSGVQEGVKKKVVRKKVVKNKVVKKKPISDSGEGTSQSSKRTKKQVRESKQTEGESVVIKNISTHDSFLNKLCSARIMFRGTAKHHETETPLVDPYENQIDAVNKVQSSVHYPTFDPDILWDKMEPTVGMRYETPHQLKLALANYGVAYGY